MQARRVVCVPGPTMASQPSHVSRSCASVSSSGATSCSENTNDGDSAYTFSFMATRNYEFGANLELTGTVVHIQDGIVGRLTGSLIDRSFSPHDSFHEICDAESDELHQVGWTFCDAHGKIRFDSVRGLSSSADRSASSGGFLHIAMVELTEAHRHNGIGLRFVRACLGWLSGVALTSAHWPDWTLAAVLPGREATDAEREEAKVRARDEGGEDEGVESDLEWEARAAREAAHDADLRKIRLQFVRLGFQQAGPASELFWVTPRTLTSEGATPSKADVADAIITTMPHPGRRDPRDKGLVDFLQLCKERSSIPGDFAQHVAVHVARGADVARCNALQFAVMSGVFKRSHIEAILAHGGSLDTGDFAGCTALHCAAATRSLAAVAALLALGADRAAVNVQGETPCNVVRRAQRSTKDMVACFGLDGGTEEPVLTSRHLLQDSGCSDVSSFCSSWYTNPDYEVCVGYTYEGKVIGTELCPKTCGTCGKPVSSIQWSGFTYNHLGSTSMNAIYQVNSDWNPFPGCNNAPNYDFDCEAWSTKYGSKIHQLEWPRDPAALSHRRYYVDL
ncbi:hypothetical protein FOA52_000354 [Chlamydomonas sp. UWO 241]|nr:hypothetical protein FOA52_000354 [Chlamydomonas sp. UWO 241]